KSSNRPESNHCQPGSCSQPYMECYAKRHRYTIKCYDQLPVRGYPYEYAWCSNQPDGDWCSQWYIVVGGRPIGHSRRYANTEIGIWGVQPVRPDGGYQYRRH